MVALSTAIAIGSTLVSAGVGISQASAAKKNAKKQNQAAQAASRIAQEREDLRLADLRRRNNRQRRENLRERLRSEGATVGGAATRGVLASSGVAGAIAGTRSQFLANEGNITTSEQVAAQIGTLNKEQTRVEEAANKSQADFLSTSARNKTIQSFAGDLFSNAQQIASVAQSASGLFKPNFTPDLGQQTFRPIG